MKSPEPNIIIDCPAPGHYVISGHKPSTVETPEGRLVPPKETYIAPELPSSMLFAVLEDRGDWPPVATVAKKKRAKREVEGSKWWCQSHKREATHIGEKGKRKCDPTLGGILAICSVVPMAEEGAE